jgi:uncharacterized protein YbaP (TraB family)
MKRLALVLLFLTFGGMAQAEPTLCGGTDLLAKMQHDDPASYAEVMKEAAATPNGEAVMWKVEREGVAPSFLLGTAHVTDPRVTTLPPPAAAAMATASTLVLELAELRSQQEMALAMMKNATKMVLPPGQTLWDLVPDADEAAIRDNPNLPAGKATGIFGFQPWLVAALISVPLCETKRKEAGLRVLDEILAEQASGTGIPVAGLETVPEQLSVFADMPLDLQTRYLVSVAKIGSAGTDYFETLISLYAQRKITAYMPFAKRAQVLEPEDEKLMTYVDENLLRVRNHRMAERARDYLDKGSAFIAVGALHLPGQEGLVELLRQKGYKVSPIN